MKPEQRPTAAEKRNEIIVNGPQECPFCGCRDTKVKHTWWTRAGEKHQARICRHCGRYEFNVRIETRLHLL